MYEFYRDLELRTMASSTYLSLQPDITCYMRSVVVDWLVQVHNEDDELCPGSLFLAVNILDRFLEKTVVLRKRLQLMGITALFLAAKFEQSYVSMMGGLPILERVVFVLISSFFLRRLWT